MKTYIIQNAQRTKSKGVSRAIKSNYQIWKKMNALKDTRNNTNSGKNETITQKRDKILHLLFNIFLRIPL